MPGRRDGISRSRVQSVDGCFGGYVERRAAAPCPVCGEEMYGTKGSGSCILRVVVACHECKWFEIRNEDGVIK